MENIAFVYSMIFFLAALLPLYWGFYIIKLDPKSTINRVFLVLNISLSIWSLGFAMTNIQETIQGALFWRRFTAIGWTSIISLILHFFLLITNEEKSIKSKLFKYRFILHIPSLILMYVFSFSNNLAKFQYNLIKVNYGWTNMTVNNFWDYLYYFYYISYLIISLYILWKWRKSLKEKLRIRQATLILITFFMAVLLSTITDLVITSYAANSFPQMAPLFILIPVWAMYYSVRYFNILDMESYKVKEKILTSKQEREIFRNLALLLFLGGVLSVLFMFFSNVSATSGELVSSLIKGSGIIILGVILLLFQKIKNKHLREELTLIILVSSIPVVLLGSINSSGITFWTYSILIIIGALLFDKRYLLISITTVAIFTQFFIWIFRDSAYVYVSGYDFALRIAFLLIAFIMGTYVNKLYVAKVRENREQISFLKLISDLTFDFLTFDEDNSDEKIQNLLKKTGKYFNVDRTYLFTINHSSDTMTYSNEWCKDGIESEIKTIKNVAISNFSWWFKQFDENNLVKIKNVNKMSKDAKAEQKQLIRQNIKSLVAVPIKENDKIYAFIGIDSVKEFKKWSKREISLLQILANILKNVLTPIQIDKQTKFMAYNDGLTKLPNRYLFIDRVNQAIRLAKEKNNKIAVFFIDLDRFKAVNDSLGHYGGDVLLQQIAKDLKSCVKKEDTVARFGGDEFLILVNDVKDLKDVYKLADRIINRFSKEYVINNQLINTTASLGIAIYEEGESADSLIRNADMAMYRAKEQGKNQYVVCTEEMKKDDLQLQELSNDLTLALIRNEFVVYYQPQIDIKTKEIVGLEALIRWNHPNRGILTPGVFIPLAEKISLIDSIDDWVFKTVVKQVKKWQDLGMAHIKVSINISAGKIKDENISNKIKEVLDNEKLAPEYIELEITESVAIDKTNLILDNLKKIQDIGVSISIDDFGTEYSSLGRLKMLPVDQLKIDMQFVQAIENSEKDRAIIKTVIKLAKDLNLSVVAEGVETDKQLAFLKKEDCDLVQGYYYYKPLPADEIEEILKLQ